MTETAPAVGRHPPASPASSPPGPSDRIAWARNLLIAIASAGFLGYHLWCAIFGAPEALIFRGSHLLFALSITFIAAPVRSLRPLAAAGLDASLTVVAFVALAYLWFHYDAIMNRIIYIDRPSMVEVLMGVALVAIVLEATRRVVGLALPLIALAFLAYAYVIADISIERLVEINYLTTEGLFGVALGVSATYVVLFVFFGSLFERSGAGRLFTEMAMALAGRASGGPAKVACLTSALFGSISGSSVANVATTGAFTIPLMKRIGYRPDFAGAVEAVASTGGQILPPIMGAAAFIMAEFLGTSYLNVAAMALAPALIFYVSVFMALHFHARREGLCGLSGDMLPAFIPVVRAHGHLVVPVVALTATLLAGYSAPLAALVGIGSIIPVVLLRQASRRELSATAILDAVSSGARNTLVVANACAVAGIVMGAIFVTGVGIDFTQAMVGLAGQQLVLALLLTMCAALVLGMGLPTAPAYIIQVALLIPALIDLGVLREAAHFFALYFSSLSAITPPVAIAVFAATAISGASVWATSRDAALLSLPAYLIPYFFVYSPALLLLGDPVEAALAITSALIGVTGLAGATMGYVFGPLRGAARLIVASASIALIVPGLWTDLLGLAALSAWLVFHIAETRRRMAEAGP